MGVANLLISLWPELLLMVSLRTDTGLVSIVFLTSLFSALTIGVGFLGRLIVAILGLLTLLLSQLVLTGK